MYLEFIVGCRRYLMDVCEILNFGFVVNCNFLGIFYRVLKYILNVFRFDIRG